MCQNNSYNLVPSWANYGDTSNWETAKRSFDWEETSLQRNGTWGGRGVARGVGRPRRTVGSLWLPRTNWVLNTIEIDALMVLEARVQGQGVGRARLSLKAL